MSSLRELVAGAFCGTASSVRRLCPRCHPLLKIEGTVPSMLHRGVGRPVYAQSGLRRPAKGPSHKLWGLDGC